MKNNKAISPIFATLIILAIVTVLFIPVFMWSTGITGESEAFWEVSSLIATERIVIEEVNLKGGVSACDIYVRNIGKTTMVIDDVIISSPADLHIYGRLKTPPDFSISPAYVVQGDLMTITINDLLFNPTINETYTVKVFTERGVGDTYQVVA